MFAYCNNNPVMFEDPSGECMSGDDFYRFQFAGHTLWAGKICSVCHKQVDWVYEQYPVAWSKVADENPHLSGAKISEKTLCIIASDDAKIKAREQATTYAEEKEIYEKATANVCFVEGTLVKTEFGDKAIEYIEVGDCVWAYDTENGGTALKRVAHIFRNETYELVTVKVGNNVIEATPEHPFYVLNCDDSRANLTSLGFGWVKAKNLRKGDILVLLDGHTATVDSVTFDTFATPIPVYNFEVEDFHTYFVGNDGLLVHNSCLPNSYGGSAAWKREDSKDKMHSFPTVVDNYATYYGQYNGLAEYRAYGWYAGHDGYFQWYVENGQMVVHRQFIFY